MKKQCEAPKVVRSFRIVFEDGNTRDATIHEDGNLRIKLVSVPDSMFSEANGVILGGVHYCRTKRLWCDDNGRFAELEPTVFQNATEV